MSARSGAAALVLALGVLALTAAPGGAQHEMHDASAGARVGAAFAAFAPTHVDVLAGESVTWHNDSVRAHTVAALDGSFASARILAGATFAHRYDQPGTFAYHCTLHAGMVGDVDVHRLLLSAPSEPGASGRPYALTGRTALDAGTEVTVEADAGSGFAAAEQTTVDVDGNVTVDVTPRATTRYRLVADADSSPPVTLLVLDRSVSATARTARRRATVRAQVTPASPGATLVLQLYLPRRFGWWPVARARVGRSGAAELRTAVRSRVRARVVLTLADGATVLARSRELHLGAA